MHKFTSLSNVTEQESMECSGYRDFPIYFEEDLILYNAGKLTKEQILKKQEPIKHKYPSHEEIKLHNEAEESTTGIIEEETRVEATLDYDSMTVVDLKALAKKEGKKGYSNMNKTQIIQLLKGI